ncbi:hypothetical protein AB0C76_32900 [Kitasatospora sp. NPDC048722]|uniref:hypothetical protein n=1 Tax=Kitasatospora sp. NPDC048722 TaxID=3155639 RepID=UPI00340D8123
MSADRERTPEEWREILARGLTRPEEARTGSRRERRAARAEHRRDSKRQTKAWIEEERRRDQVNPVGAILAVVLILGLGLGARWLWPSGGGHQAAGPAPAASAAPSLSHDDQPPTATTTAPDTPEPTHDRTNPDTVAQEAIRLYLTRDTVKDQDHKASVERAAPYLTPALTANMEGHSDPGFTKLVSQGAAAAKVTTVTTAPADSTLPPDTPLRVWRKVTATITVTGYDTTTQTTVLSAEVTLTDDNQWRVSALLGL